MSDKVDQALGLALKNLIGQLSKNDQLSKFSSNLSKRKQYDICERQYIQNQRLRKQLGNEYESSDSQQQKENQYNKMSSVELKKMIRKNLIDRNFDEDILEDIKEPQQNEPEIDQFMTVGMINDQVIQQALINCGFTQLNIIKEAKEVSEQQIQVNNFGLSFLIEQLQKIEKINLMRVK